MGITPKMKDERGQKSFPIWFIGDSTPKNWVEKLEEPFDARHPARHNIITPIFDKIQDIIFRNCRKRIDTTNIYIRNAVYDSADKPERINSEWNDYLNNEMIKIKNLIDTNNPVFVFTFGAFSYEFIRRGMNTNKKEKYISRGANGLGKAFQESVNNFDINKPNVFPLLHVSIARGQFLSAHRDFSTPKTPNYFNYTAQELAKLFIAHGDVLKIWI